MTTMNLKITSINARGIISDFKRKKLFLWIENQKIDIVFVQETYCTKMNYAKIQKEWKGLGKFCLSNSAHSRGVATLFRKGLKVEIINVENREDGRGQLINAVINDNLITFINIYGPNKEQDRNIFFYNISKWIKDKASTMDNMIIGGDFNVCLNDIDRSTRTHDKDKSRKSLKDIMAELNLIDAWVNYSKQADHYTWEQNNTKSRLDYFLTSVNASYNVSRIYTNTVISNQNGKRLTDHKSISIEITIFSSKRGPGYWKLNTSLLKHDSYIKEMEREIQHFLAKNNCSNSIDQWEMLKIKAREHSIKLAKHISKMKKDRIMLIEKEMDTCTDENEKLEKQNELNILYCERVIGDQIRSKSEMIDDSAYNTKLYKSLEKAKQMKNSIECLKNTKGTESTNQNEIMEILTNFYRDLYTSKNIKTENINDLLQSIDIEKKVSQNDKKNLDQAPSIQEVREAIDAIKENKSPGIDGLPIEFYKTFWQLLENPYMEMIKESIKRNIRPFTTRTAILSILHKKGDKTNLKNYRPISLNNTDYKIITQVYSRRLQKVIGNIVHDDQTGYVKGRNIATSVRKD